MLYQRCCRLPSNGTTLTDVDVALSFFIGPNTTFHASLMIHHHALMHVVPLFACACVCMSHVDIVCGMCVCRLAVLNQKLTSLERQVEYIEARVTKT